jgi:predicted metal-dependent HD superfamily phosphohydrolase
VPALLTSWSLDLDALLQEPHPDAVARHGADLLRRWASPGRRYHTTAHLVEMFWALEELEDAGAIDAREGCLARVGAWFHDAVYEPAAGPGANETASAELARDTLHQLGAQPHDVEVVAALVSLTETHDTPADDDLACAFQDSDLWILAAPQPRFEEYCAQVREEYAHVDEAAYRTGRLAILEPLARRDTLYRTSHARRTWEQPARVNLAREVARLSRS